MAQAEAVAEMLLPSPIAVYTTADVRMLFADISKRTPRNVDAERAFLAGKLHVAGTHPTLPPLARTTIAEAFVSGLKELASGNGSRTPPRKETAPVPGGVGYGMFYNDVFKTNWGTATAIYWEIICPTPPGGNIDNFLYLTATNRSAKGVEAFVAYDGQNQSFFKVFDWARYPSEPWQTNIAFANLGSYLRTESAHGNPYQVLPLMNVTSQTDPNRWYNQVWLWNHGASRWDLVYQYDYSATLTDQQTGWVGSWGPIIETFQDSYQGTYPLGALSTQLIGRDSSKQWGAWHFLALSDSYVRTDNKGFNLLFCDPNYSWAVNS